MLMEVIIFLATNPPAPQKQKQGCSYALQYPHPILLLCPDTLHYMELLWLGFVTFSMSYLKPIVSFSL